MDEMLKRELNKTYLILKSDAEIYEESYELQMIVRNAPQMILPLRVMRVDREIQLYYDISSKQTLRDQAERQKISGETIRVLFESVDKVLKEVREYLLDMESLILDMEHIYVKEGEFFFCYCPWERKDSMDAIRQLLEQLLGKLDYRDIKGVELAYHLYQNACRGNVHIEEILNEHSKTEKKTERETGVCEKGYETLNEESSLPEQHSRKVSEKESSREENPAKSRGFLKKILQFFLKKQPGEEDVQEIKQTKLAEYPQWEEEVQEELRIADCTEVYHVEEKKEFWEYEGDTVLLNEMEVRSWRLQPMADEYPVFYIREGSFVIGKKKGAVDGYIERNTISRIHSRLLLRQGRLFITDANSTNGTFVNGEPIEPGQEVEIFSGNRILFADVAYECYNSL